MAEGTPSTLILEPEGQLKIGPKTIQEPAVQQQSPSSILPRETPGELEARIYRREIFRDALLSAYAFEEVRILRQIDQEAVENNPDLYISYEDERMHARALTSARTTADVLLARAFQVDQSLADYEEHGISGHLNIVTMTEEVPGFSTGEVHEGRTFLRITGRHSSRDEESNLTAHERNILVRNIQREFSDEEREEIRLQAVQQADRRIVEEIDAQLASEARSTKDATEGKESGQVAIEGRPLTSEEMELLRQSQKVNSVRQIWRRLLPPKHKKSATTYAQAARAINHATLASPLGLHGKEIFDTTSNSSYNSDNDSLSTRPPFYRVHFPNMQTGMLLPAHQLSREVTDQDLIKNIRYARKHLQGSKRIPTIKAPIAAEGSHIYTEIVMEEGNGKSLDTCIDDMSRETLVEVVRTAAVECVELKKRRIIHRDVKPENILVTKEGEVSLIDLDAAGKVGSIPRYGSDAYLPPDWRFGTTENFDAYALASILAQKVLGGLTPNESYDYNPNLAGTYQYTVASNTELSAPGQTAYNEMCKMLEERLQDNPALAQIIKGGLHPLAKQRTRLDTFAQQLEQLCDQAKVFPTISERDLIMIDSEGDLGEFLGKLSKSLELSDTLQVQAKISVEQITQTLEYFHTGEAYNPPKNQEEVVEFFAQLTDAIETNVAPECFPNVGQPMNQSQRESIKMVLRIHGIADSRFHYPPYHQAVLVMYSLKLLEKRESFANEPRYYPTIKPHRKLEGAGGRVAYDLLEGFKKAA